MNEEQHHIRSNAWRTTTTKWGYKNEWTTNITKNLTGGSPKQKYHHWEFLLNQLWIKKMITEVLLILPLYLILFFIWWRFRYLIKTMAGVGNILNDNDFFSDVVDAPKEGIEQHWKRECLKSVISMGKAHLLGHKWTQERVDKDSDEAINKIFYLFIYLLLSLELTK